MDKKSDYGFNKIIKVLSLFGTLCI